MTEAKWQRVLKKAEDDAREARLLERRAMRKQHIAERMLAAIALEQSLPWWAVARRREARREIGALAIEWRDLLAGIAWRDLRLTHSGSSAHGQTAQPTATTTAPAPPAAASAAPKA